MKRRQRHLFLPWSEEGEASVLGGAPSVSSLVKGLFPTILNHVLCLSGAFWWPSFDSLFWSGESLPNGRIKIWLFWFQIWCFPCLPKASRTFLGSPLSLSLSLSSSDRMFSFLRQEAAYFIKPFFPLSQEEVPLAFSGLAIFSVSSDHIPAKAFLCLQIDCD